VRLRHTALPNPVIDLNTCTETWSQTGTWTLRHGTGIDAFAQGAGTFTLRGLAAFPFNRRGVCVLVKHPDADPLFSDFAVAAHGWASVPV
jgi:hypothetical protein